MLHRRGLIGLFAVAPAIIAADRLMPVHSPRPLRQFTMADLEFVDSQFDFGFTHQIGAEFRLNGEIYRHAVALPSSSWPPNDLMREHARSHLLHWANETRRAYG